MMGDCNWVASKRVWHTFSLVVLLHTLLLLIVQTIKAFPLVLPNRHRCRPSSSPATTNTKRHLLQDKTTIRTRLCLFATGAPTESKLSHPPSILSSSITSSSNYETYGDAALVTNQTFEELYSPSHLPTWLTRRCAECGWTHPTIIQRRALDAILLFDNTEDHNNNNNNNNNNSNDDDDDVVIQSQTGSGKTLAYLLPLLARIDPSRAAIQALVVVPTRELGLQVARVAKRLAVGASSSSSLDEEKKKKIKKNKKKIMVMSILQGSQHRRQRAWAWAEPPHVVIGTPQELTNMVRYGGIRYNAVQYVVVDEVDACLLNNAGSMTANLVAAATASGGGPLHELLSRYLSPTFELPSSHGDDDEPLTNLLESSSSSSSSRRPLSRRRQTVFCSATIPQHRYFLKQCVQNQWTTREPTHVCVSPGELLPPTMRHGYVVCASQDKKLAALRRLLLRNVFLPDDEKKKGTRVLIFAEPHRPMEQMAQHLANHLGNGGGGGGGVYWKEGYDEEQEASATAIVSVLRYEDSLSKRASAMRGFQGSHGGSIEGRRFDDDDDDVMTNNKNTSDDDNKIRVLFSTDLAARGLDVNDISHVIMFDLPQDADTYVHRAGRTGRLGRRGMVISLVTDSQEFVLERLANKLSLDLKCIARQQKKR